MVGSDRIHMRARRFVAHRIQHALAGSPWAPNGTRSWQLETLAFFISAGFVSSTLQLFFGSPGIGFSGVVYAMGGFIWAAWPRYTGFLEGFTSNSLRWLLIWQALCFALSWGGMMPIANTAHISGMAFGFLAGLWACRGTRKGWYWLAATVATLLGCVALIAVAATGR